MKIAHSLVVTPGLCGLYQTAKEIILAEQELEHTPFVVEPNGASKGMTDNDITIKSTVTEADVIIDHSGCDAEMLASGLPIVHIRHGRPLSTFLTEHNDGLKVYSHLKRIGANPKYIAIVTMWKEHITHLEMLMRRNIDYIPPPVDLNHFSPEGSVHDFGDKRGNKNIIIADMWRDDSIPFEAINTFLINCPKLEDKLHIYAIQKRSTALNVLLELLGDHLGEVGWAKDMAPIYRAADKVITCATIATRVVREALACGCKITTPESVENNWCYRGATRGIATQFFNPLASALALIKIIENNLVTA